MSRTYLDDDNIDCNRSDDSENINSFTNLLNNAEPYQTTTNQLNIRRQIINEEPDNQSDFHLQPLELCQQSCDVNISDSTIEDALRNISKNSNPVLDLPQSVLDFNQQLNSMTSSCKKVKPSSLDFNSTCQKEMLSSESSFITNQQCSSTSVTKRFSLNSTNEITRDGQGLVDNSRNIEKDDVITNIGIPYPFPILNIEEVDGIFNNIGPSVVSNPAHLNTSIVVAAEKYLLKGLNGNEKAERNKNSMSNAHINVCHQNLYETYSFGPFSSSCDQGRVSKQKALSISNENFQSIRESQTYSNFNFNPSSSVSEQMSANNVNIKVNSSNNIAGSMSEKPFKCENCSYTCQWKSALDSHKRKHTSEKPFKCKSCSHAFKHKCSLVHHIQTHSEENPFKCVTCSLAFTSKFNLVQHMRTHTKEKPFTCETCAQSFSQKKNLILHMRTHIGEKPFKCGICSQTFTCKDYLDIHMRTHTREKPFKCELCAKSFSQKSNFTKHMRTHTGEKPFKCGNLFTSI